MKQTKLAQLLHTLKEEEVKAFSKFLQSPYFNNSVHINGYWELLKKQFPDFSTPLTPEKLFKRIYPKEIFQEKKLRQLRSRLLKLLEEFLAIEQFRKDDFGFKKRVADVYLEKELKKEFEKKYHLLLKDLEKEDFLTDQELHRKLSLYHELYFNHLHNKKDAYPQYLEISVTLLEKYYARHRQLYALEWFSTLERYNFPLPPPIEKYKNDLLQKEISSSYNLENIYEHILKLFLATKGQEGIYYKCKDLVATNYHQLPTKEKNVFLKLLINFCVSRFRESNKTNQELFFLYSLGLSDNSIFYKDKMTNVTFLMIVNNAIKLKKINWAKTFINNEKYRLYENQRAIYLNLAEASILFYSKKFKDCLDVLSRLDSTQYTIIEAVRKSLQIRTIFECFVKEPSYKKMLLTNIDSFNKYLTRKSKLVSQKRITFLTFNKLLTKLIFLKKESNNDEELQQLKLRIDGEQAISEMLKNWLISHILLCTKEKGLCETTLKKI